MAQTTHTRAAAPAAPRSSTRFEPGEDEVLRLVLEGTAAQTGQAFFRALVRSVAQALGVHGAWVTEYLRDQRRLRAIAFKLGPDWLDGFEYDLEGTPCAAVVEKRELVHVPEHVIRLYPGDNALPRMQAVSYLGAPLLDDRNEVLGNLAVLDTQPMPAQARCVTLFRIFAARAAAELMRVRAEAEVRRREQALSRLLAGAMDAVLEIDADLHLTQANAAAGRVLEADAAALAGADFARFLTPAGQQKLLALTAELAAGKDHAAGALWIPGGVQMRSARGQAFAAEGTLARYELDGRAYHTLILRNVDDRLEAERRIDHLQAETEYLRAEIRRRGHAERIIGRSPAMQRVLEAVAQVAPTDATVLIEGETGTGKELIARALHEASPRRGQPLVCVNCAAIPEALMESEFFGHEKGAFTGATQKRRGRFALADGGTIFLDEVGELPLDLQPKLLRVLQEGEFEPVGGSQTQRVNVRVVAATNRNLRQAVAAGRFREDLYFRLQVFPLPLPPLRERGEDVVLLAEAFLEQMARRMRRPTPALSPADARRLQAYAWPGNVRELENVIERALIVARDGRLDLARALPETEAAQPPDATTPAAPTVAAPTAGGVRTAQEMLDLERSNIERALETCGGRVAGEQGAARLLGVPPSTLTSRIKALGIRRRQTSGEMS